MFSRLNNASLKKNPKESGKYKLENLHRTIEWVDRLVDWYNNEHKNSRIKFLTPFKRHPGLGWATLAIR